MENNQDNWEKIINLTEEYQPNDSLANEVITKLNQRESTVRFRKAIPIWAVAAVCLVISVAILLTYFLINKKDVLYLSDESLLFNDISDIDEFVETNNLSIHYVNTVDSYNKCANVKDNGKVAYVEQIFFYLGNNNFEQVNLKIVLIEATYGFSDYFVDLNESLNVEDIDVQYNTILMSNRQYLYAKFSLKNVEYYIEIANVNDKDKSLEGIVNLLLSS